MAASLFVIFNSHISELHETNTEELQHDGPAETLICIVIQLNYASISPVPSDPEITET